jgi:hypothetical protein
MKMSSQSSQIGERHPPPRYANKYHFTEKNEVINEDRVTRPGPVLTRALKGKMKKGKRGGVPSAAQVADRLAACWS